MIDSFGRKWTFILDPFCIILKKIGVSANTLSIIGLIMCIASGFCFGSGSFVCGSLSLLIAGLLDILDGRLARMDKKTKFGAFLDSSLDRYGDSFVLCGIVYYYIEKSDLLVIVGLFGLIGSYLTSYTKARIEKWIKMENVGILGRPERFFLLIIGGLTRMNIALWILAILSNITAFQRVFYAKGVLKNLPEGQGSNYNI